MTSAATFLREDENTNVIFGKAPIVRAFYEKRDISLLWDNLFSRVSANLEDAAAFMDVSILLNTVGEAEKATISQQAALGITRTFHIRNGDGSGRTVLVFVTAGNFMANTPIEFLLEGSNTNLILHYVDAETTNLDDVPAHDVAFMAIGESAENLPVLENMDRLLKVWQGPVMNEAPLRVIDLSRDGVANTFANEPSILAPPSYRVARTELQKLAANEIAVETIAGGSAYPVIVRPLGTHAGKGMEKIRAASELVAYLANHAEQEFFVTPFVDYSGPDGKFRKQRIAFIDGRAYASHMAISENWMVHYLNAGMTHPHHADRRQEEADWMATFDEDFAPRYAEAFAALHRRFGLDYFAIDCAELPDRRLLVFEADVAMIVHSLDPDTLFPYKKPAMTKLFAAFESALSSRATRSAGESAFGTAQPKLAVR